MDDDYGYEMEAIEQARFDADLEQAEWNRLGRLVDAAHAAGRCTHGSTVGYLAKPFYPEQEGLKPGESRCTSGCGRVFTSNAELLRAAQEAIYGS